MKFNMALNMHTLFISVILIISSACYCDALSCPNGWTLFDESCYVLVQKYLDWFESKVACDVLGGHLVEINDAQENTFVTNMLVRQEAGFHSPQHPTLVRAWIGLFDFLIERDFLWTTTRTEPQYTNWFPGEPNNSGDEDCVEIQPSGHWNDETCSDGMWAFCETTAIEGETVIG